MAIKFVRPSLSRFLEVRFSETPRFIQVLSGPRQTGKTTLAMQTVKNLNMPVHFTTADEPSLKDHTWIEQQWKLAATQSQPEGKGLLIIDEIQKIPNWSETVKRLWDAELVSGHSMHVLLLGSSSLIMQEGLSESLAGRYEIIHSTHWSFAEMQEAFGANFEEYIYYGGYPGAFGLTGDHVRWRNYVLDAIVEPAIARDVLLMARVDKPALLRQLFQIACSYSGQILAYQKMVGQLQDAGNTVTLAHYLKLLGHAGLVTGMEKHSERKIRQRASSPKLMVLNTGLMSAMNDLTFEQAKLQPDYWGRLVESAVGSWILNSVKGTNIEVHYWLDRNREMDFVLRKGEQVLAFEVKSGRRRTTLPVLTPFMNKFPKANALLIGDGGIALKDFFAVSVDHWF